MPSAILIAGRWRIANLVPIGRYGPRARELWPEGGAPRRVWSEQPSTAFVCGEHEVDLVVDLDAASAKAGVRGTGR